MISQALKAAIGRSLGTRLVSVEAVRGGDINAAFHIHTPERAFFVKAQFKPEGADMFAGESSGLLKLKGCGAVRVPEVIVAGIDEEETAFLVLSWHEPTQPDARSWKRLGSQLAQMHVCTDRVFGFPEDNFIGLIPQRNDQHAEWPEFYASMRIEAVLERCKGELSTSDIDNWLSIRKKLPSLIACEHPSLLHGDLWGGNAMHTDRGPMIFDPAVYYGDRLVDIAMTKLFGGFPQEFYDAYFASSPAPKGARERIEIYQLYYLLVHLALFGRSYLSHVRGILNRYA